jgi:MFS family permease
MTPIYGPQIGLSAATTVGLVTALSVGGMLAQSPVGWLSDRYDRRLILLCQGIVALALCGLIAWVGRGPDLLLYLLFFAYGGTVLTIYPVALAFANSQLHPRHMVAASGALLFLYSIGNVLMPGVAAGMMQAIGPHALFLMLGAGAVMVVAAALYNLSLRTTVQRRPA